MVSAVYLVLLADSPSGWSRHRRIGPRERDPRNEKTIPAI
jgi:hypothetical protein